MEPETAEEIVTMAYENGMYIYFFLYLFIKRVLQVTCCYIINDFLYNLGINYFDICDPCGTDRAEQEIGRIVRKKGWNRRSYVVSTRVYWHRL